ncbi:MAG: ABC transporter substrate-binding protein [Nitriliruptoraceae bacterium]|nr:ABC transporter substrate-binding protein [Nitriliruptoraceae bacterium]
MPPRSRTSVWAVLFGVAALLLACTTPEDEPEPTPPSVEPPAPAPDPQEGPRAGGTLRIGLPSDPVSLDPRFVLDDAGELVVDALFEPLVRVDPRGVLRPGAATAWEVEDGGTRFVFTLREARFHDDTPVTAEDVKRTFDTIADGTAEQPSFLGYLVDAIEGFEAAQEQGDGLSGVEVLDERTVAITLSEPNPGYLSVLSDPSLSPIPAVAEDDPEAFATQPIGNGPFAVAGTREPGAFIRLAAVPDHHRAPYLDEVVLTIYGDDADGERQWTDLVDGQLQVASVGPERREEAVALYGPSRDGYAGPGLLDGTTTTIYLYGFDTTSPPFDDPRVRRAVSLAIDREALAEDVMRGTRVAADALLPPAIPGAAAGRCEDCRFDPTEARELIGQVRSGVPLEDPTDQGDGGDGDGDAPDDVEAAGDATAWDDEAGDGSDDAVDADEGEGEEPTPVEIDELVLTHTRGSTHAAIAEAMADTISETLDVEVSFVAQDLQRLVTDARAGELELFRFGWDTNDLDPSGFLRPLFHSESVGLDNLTRYEVGEVDEALDAARAMPRSPARHRAFGAVEERILADLPVLPLLWYRHQTVVTGEVRDLVYSPLGRIDLSVVWLDDPED